MKKREIILLLLLFIGIYAFVFVQFIWKGVLPKMEEVKAEIETVRQEKAKLDEDLKNIDKLKNSLSIKKVQDERFNEYLMDDASSADSIVYLDKLAKLFEQSVTNMSFSNPVKKQIAGSDSDTKEGSGDTKEGNGSVYFEFKISFSAVMTYDEVMDIVDFVEGGSRKVKIANFQITPSTEIRTVNNSSSNTDDEGNNIENNENNANVGLFNVNLVINMYARNLGSAEQISNYFNNNFHTFSNNDGKVIVPNMVGGSQPVNDGVANTGGDVDGNGSVSRQQRDIDIRLRSFFEAGPNVWVYGAGGYANNLARFKTKGIGQIEINLQSETYTIRVTSPVNKVYNLQGALSSNNETNIFISSEFPIDVADNQNLGLNIKINNNSGRAVNVEMAGDQRDKIHLTDRNGVAIYGSSESEDVKIK